MDLTHYQWAEGLAKEEPVRRWNDFAKYLATGNDPRLYERLSRLESHASIHQGDDLLCMAAVGFVIFGDVKRVAESDYLGKLWRPDYRVTQGVELIPQGEMPFTIGPAEDWHRFQRRLL